MTVERNDDGSITIRSKNSVSTISRTFLVVDEEKKEEFQQLIEKCAKSIKPCEHSFKEMEEYFLDHCDALLLEPDSWYLRSFLYNVVLNHCKDKLKPQPRNFSFDMSDEKIEEWRKEQDVIRDKVLNSTPEDYGLNVRGYYLPHTERNAIYYEESDNEVKNLKLDNENNLNKIQQQEIYFHFEETTGQCQANGGGHSLMNKLTIFRGVSEEDIKSRNQRFLRYVSVLRDMGELSE